MKFFTRKRLIVGGIIVAFVAVLAAIGAVSRSTSSPVTTTPVTTSAPGAVPNSTWYWTMAVSPSDPNVLVLATANGLFRSADGGTSWASTGPPGVNMTSVVLSGSSMFAGGGKGATPVMRKNNARAAADGPAVLAVSTDQGKSWKVITPTGLPNQTIQALAVDPGSNGTLYALQNTGKLYSSTDGAKSFQLVTGKLGIAPWALAVAQGDHFVGGDMDSGSHVSTNAKAWLKVPFKDQQGNQMVMEYAVAPNDQTHLLMTSIGVEASTDGGKTWHVALKSTTMFGPVAWAPSSPKVAYAVDFNGLLWRSDDGGTTWKKVT